jgi:hypothetical protein
MTEKGEGLGGTRGIALRYETGTDGPEGLQLRPYRGISQAGNHPWTPF